VTIEAAVINTSVGDLVQWGDSCTLRSVSVSNVFAYLVLSYFATRIQIRTRERLQTAAVS